MFTLTKCIESDSFPVEVRVLLRDDGVTEYGSWWLTFYKDFKKEVVVESWDNDLFVNDILVKGSEARRYLKEFIKSKYPETDCKAFCKKVRKLWKFKNS